MGMFADYFECIKPSRFIAVGLRLGSSPLKRSPQQSVAGSTSNCADRTTLADQRSITADRAGSAHQVRLNDQCHTAALGDGPTGSNAKHAELFHRASALVSRFVTSRRLIVVARLVSRTMPLFLFAASLALSPFADAKAEFPEKPIRLILPFGPAGVSDVTARILADKLSQKFGEQVVVENMPGPGGINATRSVLRAPADGYTLGVLSNGTAISVDMFEHLPFDPVKQFAMVSEIGSFDLVIVVSAHSRYRTLEDLIATAKANPGKLNLGTISAGSTQNLGAELFRSMSGEKMMIVPYKNSPDIVLALLRGDVGAMLDFLPAVEGQVKDGQLRIVATSGRQRSPFLKDVPTAAESGVPGYDVSSWNGIFAPTDTPKNVIDRLNAAIAEVLAMPDVKAKFATLGVVTQASKPQELLARLKGDIKKWNAVIEAAGIPKK